MPRPVILDLDGVLVDSEPLYETAFRAFVSNLGRPDLFEWFENTLGRRDIDFADELGRIVDRPRDQVLEGLASELGLAAERLGLEPMPFAVDAINHLEARGHRLGVASSSSTAFIERALATVGVADRFGAVAAGDEAQRGKPHPELYLTVAERLGVHASTCIAIEDSPAGVGAATAAGMTVLAVPNRLTAGLDLSAAHAVVPSLEEAVRVILWLDCGD